MSAKVFEECLGYFEVFRRLGFSNERIYIVRYGQSVCMELRFPGREFICAAGELAGPMTDGEFKAAWNTHAARWNGDTPADELWRVELVERSNAWRNRVELVRRLQAKGFVVKPDAALFPVASPRDLSSTLQPTTLPKKGGLLN